MRKLLVVVAALLVALLFAGVAIVVGVHLTHPRDESAYLGYLKQYGDTHSDKPVADLPPRRALVTEGDRACDWLGDQPVALWRTGRTYRFGPVLDRYMEQHSHHALSWGSVPPDRSSIVAGAWAHLCPATWELHQPHPLRRNNGGD